jgi:prepilin-type N-terminal cleavage/methylation domain-containing protein
MCSKGRHSEAGFTLIEALVAIVILSFGLIAIANLFVVATSSNRIGNLTTAATTQANEVMEKLKAISFTTLFNKAAGGTVGSLTADLPAVNNNTTSPQGGVTDCVIDQNTFNCRETVPGIGTVVTRWTITDPGAAGSDALFITVRSEVLGFLGRQARVEYTTFRTCTTKGCPCCP